ncbi:hypothetical protein CR51_31815 [Caballeronia megalochromosomata]|nr:hypothetical protein CR51_31815 [Caballeronia megalochromosomata]
MSGTRANILRPCENLLKGDILEIGAGCGAITRYLGESGANVFALEGSFRRATIARLRTRDLPNVSVIAERFDDFRSEQRFDVITLIGVLEYANLFTGGADPHRAMLERTRSLLKPGGKIIIAIENQLGLKYFAGAPEDHLGQPMYGIEGRYRNDQPQTFGRKALSDMLWESGYLQSQFLAPFPDYKLPTAVISETGMHHPGFDAAALAAQTVRRDPQLPPYCNFALELAWPQIFDNGIGLDLANSFLIIASSSDAPIGGPDALAYHYSTDRRAIYCKETSFRSAGAGVEVVYTLLAEEDHREVTVEPEVPQFRCPATVAYSKGKALSLDFVRIATRDTWSIEEIGGFLKEYVRRLAELARRPERELTCDAEAVLPGMFFDILPQNIIIRDDGSAEIIDKEWSTVKDVPVQRLLFRTLLWMSGALTAFGTETTAGITTRVALIREGLGAAGYPLTDERYETFIELECVAQRWVTGTEVSGFIRRWIGEPLPRYTLGQALKMRDGEIAERDYRIDSLTSAQAAHEFAHARLMAQRDQEIVERDQQLVERDREIARLVTRGVEHAQTIVERDDEITLLGNQIRASNELLRYANSELQRIRNTKVFRLIDALSSPGFEPRRIAKIGYLSAALVTPQALRTWLRPAIARLRRAAGATPAVPTSSGGAGLPSDAMSGQPPGGAASGTPALNSSREVAAVPADFDAEFYLQQYADVRESGADPYEHYVLYGKSEGRQSTARTEIATAETSDFDESFYLLQYPDIRDAGVNPHQHFILHGKAEGRTGAPPVVRLHTGTAGMVPGRETVLVVTHEASRSGAPILSLNIIRHLKEFNVVSLLLGDGPMLDAFLAVSAVTVGPTRIRGNQIAGTYVVDKLLETFKFSFAITNSVESSVVLKGLAQHGVPTVCLIHEFAAYTRPRQVFPEAIRWASQSVFSANVTHENAVSLHPDLADAPFHLLPQGRCEIYADEGEAERTHADVDEDVCKLLRPEGTSADTVVILGLGTVQLRKGVDLFLDCAAHVLRANPDANFRFVWFGKGYDPHSDLQYSAYLIEQIKRSGLEKHVVIFDETPSIEAVYRQSDILLVTSRLDPLPNVAIDSMTDGLPVLCFEKATGIADILLAGGLGEACVSPYLDTAGMAAQTSALIRSKSFRESVGEQSRQLALKTFDMPKYVDELKRLASTATTVVVQQEKDVATILEAGVVRFDFLDGSVVDNRPAKAKVLEHVRSWSTGVSRRKVMPGFDPGVYMEQSSAWREGVDPTASFLREGQPDGPWKYEVITEQNRGLAVPEGTRVGLHVHAYYADLLAQVTSGLNKNSIRPDLFVSIGDTTDRSLIDSALKAYAGSVVDVKVVPNVGRDIGPFLSEFGEVIAGAYDIVGHLHTKKTVDLETTIVGKNWYRFLILNLLGGENKMADIIVGQLANDRSLGLVFADDPHEVGWGKNKPFAESIARQLRIDVLPKYFSFPVGTMFWARVNALQPLFDLRLGWADYPVEPLPYDGSTLHALERLLPFVVAKQGYRFATSNVSGVSR